MSDRSCDVLVVGGGAAGVMAAAAAKEAGARVILLARAMAASALSSGAIDLAGDSGDVRQEPLAERASLRENLSRILTGEPWHPFHAIAAEFDGPEGKAGHVLRLFGIATALLQERGGLALEQDGEENRARITVAGTFKFTASAPSSMGAFDAESLRRMRPVFVGFPGLPGSMPEREAAVFDSLRAVGQPQRSQWVEVPVPEVVGPNSNAIGLASLLDEEAFAKELAEKVAKALSEISGANLAVLPAVLGFAEHERCLATFAQALDIPIVETLATSPSVPGVRLQLAFDRLLAGLRVERLAAELLPPSGGGRTLEHLEVETTGGGRERISFGRLVLATGKFLGGGLRKEGAIREALLGLPVFWQGRPMESANNEEIFNRRFLEPQPAFATGVMADGRMRAMGEGGRPRFENVHVAGALLGGYDSVAGPSGLGLALVSGYAAGQCAAAG